MRLFLPGAFGLVMFLVWIYAVFDVIATDSALMRNLPKMTWVLLVVFIPTVGAVAWLALGRPLYAGWAPGDTRTRSERRPTTRQVRGPEDSDDWAAAQQASRRETAAEQRRLAEWEAELDRRQQALDADPDDEESN